VLYDNPVLCEAIVVDWNVILLYLCVGILNEKLEMHKGLY